MNQDNPAIMLEPRKIFNKAIVGYTNNQWPIYDFDKLVIACRKTHKLNRQDALEWVDYNVVSYADNGLLISTKRP